jgi:hypothetical protein
MHHLGLAHSPVLHRQMSSPTSKSSADSSGSDQDVTQDSKDVLVERLNDLVSRLSSNDALENGTVSAIHSQVDSIETLMRGSKRISESPEAVGEGLGPRSPRLNESSLWGPPLTPTRNVRSRLPRLLEGFTAARQAAIDLELLEFPTPFASPASSSQPQVHMTSSRIAEISKAAEDLAVKLEATVSELKIRRKESDVRRLLC